MAKHYSLFLLFFSMKIPSYFSFSDHLKYRLDFYISFLPKVRIIRIKKSIGKMAALQEAVNVMKSKYFAVIDSHCEVHEGTIDDIHCLLHEPSFSLLCRDEFKYLFIFSDNVHILYLILHQNNC